MLQCSFIKVVWLLQTGAAGVLLELRLVVDVVDLLVIIKAAEAVVVVVVMAVVDTIITNN